MTSRFKRRMESAAFFMRRAYSRVITAKPSMFVVAAVAVALCIFLLGGGVYDILEKPPIAIPFRGTWIFYYPYTVHEQLLLESLIAMTLYFIGAVGLLLTYQSTKYAYKSRQASTWLLISIVFIVIASIFIEYTIWLKITAS